MPSFSMDQLNFVLLIAGFGPVPVAQQLTGLGVWQSVHSNLPLVFGERGELGFEGLGEGEECWKGVGLKSFGCAFQCSLGNSQIVVS